MRKEFGKWLMDIVKYITTVVILSSAFSNLHDMLLLLPVAIVVATAMLVLGLWLVREDRNTH